MSLICSVYIATSLDGFIAKENGELDWLDAANATVPKGEDCGYQAFMDSVDALVMGRNTYEKVLSFGRWPYGEKPVFVLSRQGVNIPHDLAKVLSHSSETPTDISKRLEQEGHRRLYIDGGLTIQRFLTEGLINDLTITIIPIVLGRGIPLFGEVPTDLPLTHVTTKSFDFGFVQLSYEIKEKVS